MPSHHLILCRRLLLLPSDFPSIGVFLVSQLFSSGSQRLGASASALPLAGEAKQEVESQCAGPGRAYGAAAAVSSEIQEQDSPMCKVASDRPSLSDHHPGLILRLWPERPVSSVGNLAGLRDCLTPVRGPLEMRAEHQRIDAFELWCWRRLLRVPWTARRSNQSNLALGVLWKE